jgi:O-antigen/teichoic acid export membrane protein
MIKDTIKSLFIKGSFTQDVFIVSSGKVIVAIIGFLFVPILSRIYSPEAYGNFSLYSAFVAFFVPLFTFSFPSAFVVAKNDKLFYNLFSLSTILLLLSTAITFLIVLLLGDYIISVFNLAYETSILWLIPAGILINGFFNQLTSWNVRRKQFALSSSVAIGHNLLIRIFNLLIGILGRNISYGLIFGNLLGRFTALCYLIVIFLQKEKRKFIRKITISDIIISGKIYRKYPLYFLPSRLLENLWSQSIVYVIGFGFSKSILGNFAIAVSVLNIPIQVIANSMSSVFLKKANDLYMSNKDELPVFIKRLTSKLFFTWIIPFSILSVFGPEMIKVFLGDQWTMAGRMSGIMAPYFFTTLIVSPILSVLQVLKKEIHLFIYNILGFILNVICLLIGLYTGNIEILIMLYTAANVLMYLLVGIYILRINNIHFIRIIIGFLLIYPLIILVLYLIKKAYIIY